MMERTFVLIFVFWAVLTIITPTLILLSENSKPSLDTSGAKREGVKAWSWVRYAEEHPRKTPIAPSLTGAEPPASSPAPTPAPAPTRTQALRARKAITRIFSKKHWH